MTDSYSVNVAIESACLASLVSLGKGGSCPSLQERSSWVKDNQSHRLGG